MVAACSGPRGHASCSVTPIGDDGVVLGCSGAVTSRRSPAAVQPKHLSTPSFQPCDLSRPDFAPLCSRSGDPACPGWRRHWHRGGHPALTLCLNPGFDPTQTLIQTCVAPQASARRRPSGWSGRRTGRSSRTWAPCRRRAPSWRRLSWKAFAEGFTLLAASCVGRQSPRQLPHRCSGRYSPGDELAGSLPAEGPCCCRLRSASGILSRHRWFPRQHSGGHSSGTRSWVA